MSAWLFSLTVVFASSPRVILPAPAEEPPAPAASPRRIHAGKQQFFVAWGQFRGDETRLETQRLMVQGDPHPIAKYRVIGPLANLPEFQKAFSCGADAPSVRQNKCEVW